MKQRVLLLLWITVAVSLGLAQSRPLTNYDVVKMVSVQMGEDVIIQTVRANAAAFDTSPHAITQLKDAGVPVSVINAMLERSAQSSSVTPPGVVGREALPNPAGVDRPHTPSRANAPLIYVEEVSSSGGIMASSDTTIEAMKTLQQHGVRVTTIKDKADYVLQVTRQLGKKRWSKDTKIALSNRDGEVVLTKSTRSIGGAMGDVSDYIRSHDE